MPIRMLINKDRIERLLIMILWLLVTSESRWIIAIVLLVQLTADEPICDQEHTWQWLWKPKQRPCVITENDGHEIEGWLDFFSFLVCGLWTMFISWLISLLILSIYTYLVYDVCICWWICWICEFAATDFQMIISQHDQRWVISTGSLLWHRCQAWMSPSFDALPKQGGTRLPNLASKHLLPLGRWGGGSGKE